MGTPGFSVGADVFKPCYVLSYGYGDDSCEFDTTVLPRLSYLSVMQAFGQLITGSIDHLTDVSTTVVDTALVDTAQELAWLNARLAGADFVDCPTIECTSQPVQEMFARANQSNTSSLVYQGHVAAKLPLAEALEVMFKNITLSLMGSAALQPNASSPYAPLLTNVTLVTYQNIYVYDPEKLWLAYGIALGVAATQRPSWRLGTGHQWSRVQQPIFLGAEDSTACGLGHGCRGCGRRRQRSAARVPGEGEVGGGRAVFVGRGPLLGTGTLRSFKVHPKNSRRSQSTTPHLTLRLPISLVSVGDAMRHGDHVQDIVLLYLLAYQSLGSEILTSGYKLESSAPCFSFRRSCLRRARSLCLEGPRSFMSSCTVGRSLSTSPSTASPGRSNARLPRYFLSSCPRSMMSR